MGTKVCSRCGRELPASDFFRNKSSKDGLAHYCKECERERRSKKTIKVELHNKELRLHSKSVILQMICCLQNFVDVVLLENCGIQRW